jgi:hypothetical protein
MFEKLSCGDNTTNKPVSSQMKKTQKAYTIKHVSNRKRRETELP